MPGFSQPGRHRSLRLQSEEKLQGLRMGQGLSSTWASELDRFIDYYLQTNISFRNDVRTVINTMCAFLKKRGFQDTDYPVRISKVVGVSPSQPELTQMGGEDPQESDCSCDPVPHLCSPPCSGFCPQVPHLC